ncbi:GEMI7 protein, partial [Serilophus lunatus]|nr:GEMI7 protein [Serilophus lunatus]
SPIPIPMGILRLPLPPDGSSRGFSRDSPRARAHSLLEFQPRHSQKSRASLRERSLRILAAARGVPARFSLRSGIRVDAIFGAADREFLEFQVDSLRTPLGVEAAALLRAGDILGFCF